MRRRMHHSTSCVVIEFAGTMTKVGLNGLVLGSELSLESRRTVVKTSESRRLSS